jgi:DNA-binding transcriptional MocR family regulator
MTNTGTIHQLPVRSRLVCSVCGADGEGTCGCGAPYLPAGLRAAAAVALDPAKSDRAIAEEIGVSDKTVAKARKATADQSAVEKRTGKDGKVRKLPKPRALRETERFNNAITFLLHTCESAVDVEIPLITHANGELADRHLADAQELLGQLRKRIKEKLAVDLKAIHDGADV